MKHATADLCDGYMNKLQVLEPMFIDFGGEAVFEGEIYTLKVFEDNTLVRTALEMDGTGKVLVIDGGASMRCALVGGNLVALAVKNNWRGLVVYGCIRDSREISELPMGVKALNTNPTKSVKRNEGQRNIAVRFAGAELRPGAYLYADEDGIVVSDLQLL